MLETMIQLMMVRLVMIKFILCLSLLISLSACGKNLDVCKDKTGKIDSCLKIFNDEQLLRHGDHNAIS